MRNSGNRKCRREWVAISSDLVHDPDFFELTIEQRYLWIMLLCHGGRVGNEVKMPNKSIVVEYELSIRCARKLFNFRPGWPGNVDLKKLEDKGFIELECNTVHEEPNHNEIKKEPKILKKKEPEINEKFEYFKSVYPKRCGGQPWPKALKAINARIKEGSTWTDIIDGAVRYAIYCSETDKIGTEYIAQAATFCGPDKRYLDSWEPPSKKGKRQQDKNINATQQWLESSDE